MSHTRSPSIPENQASASENESEKTSAVSSRMSNQNENLNVPGLDESNSPTSQKRVSGLSSSTGQLKSSERTFEDASTVDCIRDVTSSTGSDKEETGNKSEAKPVILSPPSVLLNSTDSSIGSFNCSLSFKEDGCEKFDNQYPIDGLQSMSPGSVSQESSLFPDNLSRSSESNKSIDLGTQRTSDAHASKSDVSKSDKSIRSDKKEKKKSSWYNMLNPTYKSRSDDFKRLFKELPEGERLIVDYSCALQKDILVQGRLYVSENYICFYANIFRWETFLMLKCRDVTSMTKEKTARVIPNAIQVTTDTERHFFTSFGSRDKTFLMLFRIWQNALLEQPMSAQEIWQWVHHSYGEELGLTTDDDDYVAPLLLEDDVKSGKLSDTNVLKDIDKSYEKSDSGLLAESGKELHSEDYNSEPATGINGSCDGHSMELIDEEGPCESVEDTKLALNKQTSELPTDMSDTTESEPNIEEIEYKCPCVTHEGKEVLSTVFPMSVDQLFALIFTGSKFYYDLLTSRKTYDIIETPWQLCPDFDLKMRQVSYTLTLNHSMAKSTHTTETQRLLKHSKPGLIYTVDCDVVNRGIPYCDTFNVKSVYCLTKVSKKESRLCISGCVRYKKAVWGLVKALIEKSAMQGFADFAADLETALHKEAENSSQQGLTKKTRRRKRMKFDPVKGEAMKDAPRNLQRQATIRKIGLDLGILGPTPDVVIRVILATLIVLLFLNMLLFYKLWSLEDQSIKQVPLAVWDYPDSHATLTKEDYMNLLQKQDSLHRAETERWREALNEIIKLIHLIEKSLTELKSSIDTYSSASVFKAIALRMSQISEDEASAGPSAKVMEESSNAA